MSIDKQEKDFNIKSSFYKFKKLFFSKLKGLTKGDNVHIDDNLIREIEYCLLSYDIGYDITHKVIHHIKNNITQKDVIDIKLCYNITRNYLYNILYNFYSNSRYKYIQDNDLFFSNIKKKKNKPYIFILVGVNGAGKTTTISKIGYMLKNRGISSVFAAADTFRVAAIEQLTYWAEKLNIPIIKESIGSDAGSIVFKTLDYAQLNNIDVVLVDTAGRLHNNINLMKELLKIVRIVKKKTSQYPDQISLVMDATIGYNSFYQINTYQSMLSVNSIIITKLDSSAKGGIFINLIDKFKIPINFISYGENINQFAFFNIEKYIHSFF